SACGVGQSVVSSRVLSGSRPDLESDGGYGWRRRFLQLAGVSGAGLLIPVQAFATSEATGQGVDGDGIVLRWNNAALQGVRESKLGPPMVARALAMVHTAMYEAWAAYDRGALGTQFGAKLRRPPRERTFRHRSQAISFAACRAAADLFPEVPRLFSIH